MRKKILLSALLVSGLTMSAQANDAINYNYLELGYDYVDLSGSNHADGLYLDGSFDLTDQFYMGAFYSNLSAGRSDVNRYGLSVGFHTEISNITDFYSQFELGQFDNRFGDSLSYGAFLGTRTAFNSRFELISKAGYTEVDDINDGFFEVGMKGLFKLTNASAITAGVESFDGDLGANVGFRFSF